MDSSIGFLFDLRNGKGLKDEDLVTFTSPVCLFEFMPFSKEYIHYDISPWSFCSKCLNGVVG